MLFRRFLTAFAVTAIWAASATAAQISFDRSWKEQGFLRFFTNDYVLRGNRMDITSDGTVSIIWRPLEPSLGNAYQAAWQWQVAEGVGATDLTRKGGDDRNLAIYFVFVDEETAQSRSRNSVRRILRNSSTRALVYVWGGAHKKGALLPSPYSNKLRTKIQRTPGTGSFSEQVDLAADYRRAFGADPGVLIGVAITADSDDTGGKIEAAIANLNIQ